MFEFFFVIFILSGYIKAILLMLSISLPDITLFSSVIITTFLLYEIYINNGKFFLYKKYKILLLIQLLLASVMLASMFYTSSPSYYLYKFFLYFMIMMSFFYPLMKKDFKYILFLRFFVFMVFILGILYLVIYPKIILRSGFDMQLEVDSLYSISASLSGISLLFLIRYKDKNFMFGRVLFLIMVLEGILILLISGARGSIFFTIISLSLYLLLDSKNVLTSFFKFIVIFLSLVIIIYFIQEIEIISTMFQRSVDRVYLLFSEDYGNSVQERLRSMNFAVNGSVENVNSLFFGNGIGSFGIDYSGVDGRMHPHNVLVEILYDIGLVGLLLYLLFFLKIFLFVYKSDRLLIAILLYVFLDLMKSSSYIEIRVHMGIMAAVMVLALANKQKVFQ